MCRIIKTTRRIVKREKGLVTTSYGGFHSPTWRAILIPVMVIIISLAYIAIEASTK